MPVSTSLAQDGGVVSVFINPSDPTKFVLHRFPYKGLGWTLIGVGLVMIVGVSINLYVALRFKFAAAAGGVSGAVNLIRQ